MLANYFSTIESYVLSVSSQRKYNFYHQNTLLDASRTNSSNVIGRDLSMVIPLLANQDLTPMLLNLHHIHHWAGISPIDADHYNKMITFSISYIMNDLAIRLGKEYGTK